MKIQIPFGDSMIPTELPDNTLIIEANEYPSVKDPRFETQKALEKPIGTSRLRELAKNVNEATIVINDITRPASTNIVLPLILDELKHGGLDESDVTILVACGNHRPSTKSELRQMIGPQLVENLHIVNHRCEDERSLIDLGMDSQYGVPIIINKCLVEAPLKILTGLITPHHLAGYSGGRKSVLPGVAGSRTIEVHHSFPIRPYHPEMGNMKDKPFHKISLEAAQRVGIDFIVNVVKNSKGKIANVVAGDLELAHEKGVEICEKIWKIPAKEKVDIAITSPGGYPRDINLHQSQKAINPAEMIVKEGGVIILVAECRDGIGKFAPWLMEASDPQEVIEKFKREGLVAEYHSSKAFMFARALAHYHVLILTDRLTTDELSKMFLMSVENLELALERAKEIIGKKECKIAVIPHASEVFQSIQ